MDLTLSLRMYHHLTTTVMLPKVVPPKLPRMCMVRRKGLGYNHHMAYAAYYTSITHAARFKHQKALSLELKKVKTLIRAH